MSKSEQKSAATKVAAREHDWGWFSREDPRMHLQTVEGGARTGPKKAKVWLEIKGKRIFEMATTNLPGADVKKLQAKVQAKRDQIEDRWTVFMAENDWLKADLKGHIVIVTAYPGLHNSFKREIDLKDWYPGAYPYWDKHPPKLDLKSSPGLLAVGPDENPDDRNHIELRVVLFDS